MRPPFPRAGQPVPLVDVVVLRQRLISRRSEIEHVLEQLDVVIGFFVRLCGDCGPDAESIHIDEESTVSIAPNAADRLRHLLAEQYGLMAEWRTLDIAIRALHALLAGGGDLQSGDVVRGSPATPCSKQDHVSNAPVWSGREQPIHSRDRRDEP